MIKVLNDVFPFKGFLAMTVWPLLFVKRKYEARFGPVENRHESIHGEQQKELLCVGIAIAVALVALGCGWWSLLVLPLFFWWYVVEWLVKWPIYGDSFTAYKNICFEREAFANEGNMTYLSHRRPFAWMSFIIIK